MSGHTPIGVPYALPADQLIDWPATSQELANWIGQHTGRELVNNTQTADSGPTGVVTTNPGSALVDLGSLTVRAVPHWWEASVLVKASAADLMFLLLYDGTMAAPGNQVAYLPCYCPVNPPSLLHMRFRFTPPAGTRNYHVRWRNNGAAGTLYTIVNSLYAGNHTIREVTV